MEAKPIYGLKKWTIVNGLAYGDVYGHPKFPDGHPIRTSEIVSEHLTDGIPKLVTLNSIYFLLREDQSLASFDL